MLQIKIIDGIRKELYKNKNFEALALIGSFGRDSGGLYSDIDYQLYVDTSYDFSDIPNEVRSAVENYAGKELNYSLFIKDKNKWCFFLYGSKIKLEIHLIYEMNNGDKYFLGSNILDINQTIAFDRNKRLEQHFATITENYKNNESVAKNEKLEYLITSFQDKFEACSEAHRRSDGYLYNVLFGQALNAVIRIIYLHEDGGMSDYMPKNFLTEQSYRLGLGIEDLCSMDLTKANTYKRKLLNIFSTYLEKSISSTNLSLDRLNILYFLEGIYKRDCMWNFRDISYSNPKIKEGLIFRGSALCLQRDPATVIDTISELNISNIIDLRSEKEIKLCNYNDESWRMLSIVQASFDPEAKGSDFRAGCKYPIGMEADYYFYSTNCKPSIKLVLEEILRTTKATLIHCHAGKDRTGIICTIFHLLSGASSETIYTDYLASEMDTKKEHLDVFLETVKRSGGIEMYLSSCGLTKNEIFILKTRITI